jgi:hypothetical protein
MPCPYCPVTNPDQRIIFREELVLFMQNEKAQGALKHSGVIIPIQHKESVFDLSEAELIATFRLLTIVRRWMNESFSPDGYNSDGITGRDTRLGPGVPDFPFRRIEFQVERHHVPDNHRVVAVPILGGLHHEYRFEKIAA